VRGLVVSIIWIRPSLFRSCFQILQAALCSGDVSASRSTRASGSRFNTISFPARHSWESIVIQRSSILRRHRTIRRKKLALESLEDRRLLAGDVYCDTILASQPDLYWRFEETGVPTTTVDVSSFGANLTGQYADQGAGGTISLGQAGPRPSGGFPGMGSGNLAPSIVIADKVENAQLQTLGGVSTSAYSASMWFNSTALFNSQVLHYVMERGIDNTAGGRRDAVGVGGTFGGTTTGQLFLTNSGTLVNGTTPLSENTWYNLTMVRDDSLPTQRLKIYLNGSLEITSDPAWGGGVGDIFRFGNRTDNNPSLGLTGLLDEGAVWNRALSAAEVSSLYLAATDPNVYVGNPGDFTITNDVAPLGG